MLALSAKVRDAQGDAIIAAAGRYAVLRIYDGQRPTPGGTTTLMLADLRCGERFAPPTKQGVIRLDPIAPGIATASGIPTWFRITSMAGDFVFDGDVGIELHTEQVGFVQGGIVSCHPATIVIGNG